MLADVLRRAGKVEPILLYDEGAEHYPMVGEDDGAATFDGTYTKLSDRLRADTEATGSITSHARWMTDGTFDLTPYSQLRVDWLGEYIADTGFEQWNWWIDNSNTQVYTAAFSRTVDYFDISGVNSAVRVGVSAGNSNDSACRVEVFSLELLP